MARRPTGTRAPPPTPRGPAPRRLALRLARWGIVLAIWLSVTLAALVGWYAWDLPELSRLETPTRRPAVVLATADGTVIARYGELYGGAVPFEALPAYFIQAVSATEDRRFFEHAGIDPWGILRAAYTDIRAGAIRQGGSTITQQLAKNLFLSNVRTLRRKIQEVIVALWLEARFTKRQIFAIYVNRAYFGSGAYGVAAASRRYFGKPIGEVSLFQAAVLAGLLKAPSRYSPAHDAAAAGQRGRQVLAAMVDAGFLTKAAADAAARSPLRLRDEVGSGARYFADWALDRALENAGRTTDDLVVVTTLDLGLQRLAEARARAALEREGAKSGVSQAAVVVLAPDGAVRAMVGGRSYSASQFNRATQALRQPGSAFKLFVYLAGLDAGLRPDDVFVDKPIAVKGWHPRNYDGRYRGPITLARAFAESVNTVAVQVSERAGRGRVIAAARRLGITTPLVPHPSLALGASEVSLIELTAAYGTVANGGLAVWPFGVIEVRTKAGKVLYRRSGSGARRVIDAGRARTMRQLMRGVIENGTGRAARLGRDEAGKTGTSQSFRDAWFVGFAGPLVAGVWVGNDDERPMRRVTGGGLPARLWRAVMAGAGRRPGPPENIAREGAPAPRP